VGDVPCGPIKLTNSVNYRKTEAAAQRRLVSLLAQKLTRAELPGPALEELEQAIIISFLYTNDSNFSPLSKADPKDCAPADVRLAEEFIETNWREPITTEKLISITNTIARSLFRSFEKTRGYTPMTLVKHVRSYYLARAMFISE
jgi:transcriptional regulator GlxA family with amidase domain